MSSQEELQREIAKLKAENETLKKAPARGLSFKVSEKGALSVYGMGRFPVTLYKEQWTRLLEKKDELLAFLHENDSKLKAKE